MPEVSNMTLKEVTKPTDVPEESGRHQSTASGEHPGDLSVSRKRAFSQGRLGSGYRWLDRRELPTSEGAPPRAAFRSGLGEASGPPRFLTDSWGLPALPLCSIIRTGVFSGAVAFSSSRNLDAAQAGPQFKKNIYLL